MREADVCWPKPVVTECCVLLLQSPLDWWPKIDAVYCYSGELRTMFAETLGRVVQSCTNTHTHTHPQSNHEPVRLTLETS